jgi:hypothetical protein
MAPPMPAQWLTVAEHLSVFDNTVAVNICFILGTRPSGSGPSAGTIAPPPGPSSRTEGLVRGQRGGSFGLSTGWTPGRRHPELIKLQGGGAHGASTTSCESAPGAPGAVGEALEIGRASGIPVHVTHYRQRSQGDGSHLDYLGLVEQSRDEGLDVTFDCYPYVSAHPSQLWVGWRWRGAGAADGDPELAQERARLREEMRRAMPRPARRGLADQLSEAHHMGYEALPADIARERRSGSWTLLDLMRARPDCARCRFESPASPRSCTPVAWSAPPSSGISPGPTAAWSSWQVRPRGHLRLPEAIRE